MKHLLLLAMLVVSACSNETAPLAISDVVVKQPMPGMNMSAGYFVLENSSSQEIVITKVTSPQFGAVEMHESLVEDGIARMVELEDLPLQPGTRVEFVPGGKHLMLMKPGDDLSMVTLEFHAGDAIILTVSTASTR